MNLFEKIISIDKDLLLKINDINLPFFNDFFLIFSGQMVWSLVAAAIIYVLLKTQKKDFIFVLFGIVLVVALSDYVSSGIIKNLVERPRPCRSPELAGMVHIIDGYNLGGFSFPSSHAANSFAFAAFSTLLLKNRIYSITIIIWALATGFSRIYLGVHFPIDVLVGSIIGAGIGFAVYYLLKKVRKICTQRPASNMYSYLIICAFICTLLTVCIWHNSLMFLKD
jgi:undecaprenyl-diphosphatase